MVPTLEAIITFQMLYSAVPPTGIASARLAMRPPVKSELLAALWRWPITLERGYTAHLTWRLFSLPLNPPSDSPLGCEPGLQWRKGTRMPPFIYGSAWVVKK